MKKLLCALLCLLCILSLAACGKQPAEPDAPVPTIRPAEFSEDAQALLALLRDSEEAIVFFDYTVDETIQFLSTNVWKYEDGAWISNGHTEGSVDPGEYRIGFRLSESGYDIFDIHETGHGVYSYKGAPDFGTGATLEHRLYNDTPIISGEEITLWSKLGAEGNEIRTTDDFRQADCTAGLAVTVTFSGTPLD